MLSFGYPWVLLLMLLPLLIYYVLPRAHAAHQTPLYVPFIERIAHLAGHHHVSIAPWRFMLVILLWIFFIIACADPRWLGTPQPIVRKGREILLVIDISGSMEIPDQRLEGKLVNRLQAVKVIAGRFIDKRIGDKLGLVLFGSRAYVLTPLTYDRNTVKAMLQDSSIGLAGSQTAVGDAIALGVKHLLNAKPSSRVMILLTDGASNAGQLSIETATEIAVKEHIKIYTIGLGANELQINTPLGVRTINPSHDLDAKSLQVIAKMSGGQYYRAEDTQQLTKIYEQIDALYPVANDKTYWRPIKHLYYWPLLAALLLTLLLTLRYLPWRRNPEQSKEQEAC